MLKQNNDWLAGSQGKAQTDTNSWHWENKTGSRSKQQTLQKDSSRSVGEVSKDGRADDESEPSISHTALSTVLTPALRRDCKAQQLQGALVILVTAQ